jgi:hypothetical protein
MQPQLTVFSCGWSCVPLCAYECSSLWTFRKRNSVCSNVSHKKRRALSPSRIGSTENKDLCDRGKMTCQSLFTTSVVPVISHVFIFCVHISCLSNYKKRDIYVSNSWHWFQIIVHNQRWKLIKFYETQWYSQTWKWYPIVTYRRINEKMFLYAKRIYSTRPFALQPHKLFPLTKEILALFPYEEY